MNEIPTLPQLIGWVAGGGLSILILIIGVKVIWDRFSDLYKKQQDSILTRLDSFGDSIAHLRSAVELLSLNFENQTKNSDELKKDLRDLESTVQEQHEKVLNAELFGKVNKKDIERLETRIERILSKN